MWKDMVERERKGHSATVEDFAPGLTSWLQRNRQYFMILLAAVAFAVLLGEHTCPSLPAVITHPMADWLVVSSNELSCEVLLEQQRRSCGG